MPTPVIPSSHDENTDTLMVNVPANVSSKDELLDILASELRFPDYFGHNWDALEECLLDLSWLKAKRIVIQHEAYPIQIGEDNLKIYKSILKRCAIDWEQDEEHELVIIFP